MESFAQLLWLLLIGAAFYLLIIRPQRNRQRQQRELVQSIGVGDRVVTIGGFHGTVRGVDDDTLHLEIARGTIVTLVRGAVARRLVDADTGDLGTQE
jgi:preprotein translocase subunit YajC